MNQFVFEAERPVVQTKYGKLRGVTYGGLNIFMGVEYAHAKRFHMPEEPECWDGIKNAYQHGPIAMQVLDTNPFFYYRGLHMLEKQSEDCQNLNIWAPKTLNGEKKAVFVWIHGGGFFSGNAFEEISFDGQNLARHGDIIFVSINHRLNILGHLNLEEYGEEFANSVNAGIWDVAAALKWIHENIAAFGGDPENVTICGHSGGGGKVQCMFQMEQCVPYFQRGICLSGARGKNGAGTQMGQREASKATAKAMMDELGITKENIDKIYDVSFADLVAACKKHASPMGFSPVANDFFPGFPAEVGLMPFSKDKPIIYGSTLGEFPTLKLSAEEKAAMTEDDKVAFFKEKFGDDADRMMELFKECYPDHDLIDLACHDSRCRLGATQCAEIHVEAGCKEVYNFLAAYDVPEDGSIPIWHGGEVAYIFMNEDKVLALNPEVYGQKYASIFSTMVINFVKNGNPNNKYLPKWEPVEEGQMKTMVIDKNCRQVVNFDNELVELSAKNMPRFKLNLPIK